MTPFEAWLITSALIVLTVTAVVVVPLCAWARRHHNPSPRSQHWWGHE